MSQVFWKKQLLLLMFQRAKRSTSCKHSGDVTDGGGAFLDFYQQKTEETSTLTAQIL